MAVVCWGNLKNFEIFEREMGVGMDWGEHVWELALIYKADWIFYLVKKLSSVVEQVYKCYMGNSL